MQRIDIYSSELEHIGALYGWISLIWKDTYNEGGSFQLEVQPSSELRELLAPDNILKYSEAGTAMVITSVQIESDDMLITGNDAAHLLANRVSTATISPSGRGGGTTAETAIRNAVSTYKGTYSIISAGTSSGFTNAFENDYTPDEIETIIQGIAQEADLGYRLNMSGGQLVLDVYYPGENANAIYSPKYRNISDISYTQSFKDLKNVCVVLKSTSDGSYSKVETIGSTSATGADRKEMVLVYSGDEDTPSAYKKAGTDALAEQLDFESIDCNISGGCELGDIVTIRVPEIGVSLKKRVKQIQITAESGSVERKYTVGDILNISTVKVRGPMHR